MLGALQNKGKTLDKVLERVRATTKKAMLLKTVLCQAKHLELRYTKPNHWSKAQNHLLRQAGVHQDPKQMTFLHISEENTV